MRRRVAFRELGVGRFGIRGGRLGIRGIAFVECIFAMAKVGVSQEDYRGYATLTLTSSHVWIFFTPSPTSLNVSFVSSRRS
jgi:hypothetical protein